MLGSHRNLLSRGKDDACLVKNKLPNVTRQKKQKNMNSPLLVTMQMSYREVSVLGCFNVADADAGLMWRRDALPENSRSLGSCI